MNRSTIRKLYREAIVNVFGCGDKKFDAELISAAKRSVHLGDQAPGGWSPESVLEIYCESGIPNATDYFCPQEHGFEGKTTYNSDQWDVVDGMVNLMLEAMGYSGRYHHEPYNAAVVNIWES